MQNEIMISAALIRDQQGRALLVRKANTSFFMQPGGKIEPGETALHALLREVREELGAGLQNPQYLGSFSAPAANEPDHMVFAEIFEAELDASPTPAAEIAEFKWVDPASAPDLPIAPLSRLLLNR